MSKDKNTIDEVKMTLTIDGIKRRAVMREIEYETDHSRVGSIGAIKWKSCTYSIGDDPDFIVYNDSIKANNFNIFSAIRRRLREIKANEE